MSLPWKKDMTSNASLRHVGAVWRAERRGQGCDVSYGEAREGDGRAHRHRSADCGMPVMVWVSNGEVSFVKEIYVHPQPFTRASEKHF